MMDMILDLRKELSGGSVCDLWACVELVVLHYTKM